MTKQSNNRALRFYQEVLGLDRLHYGLWRPEEELSLSNLKEAQKRYEDLIVDHIPDHVQSIIDVGCGTGILLARLKQMGFQAEGLTPDVSQQQIMRSQGLAPVHCCRFEDFHPSSFYDCIIMSESAQYIPLEELFNKIMKALRPGGFLMVCDYFVLNHAQGIIAKSGHNFERFLQIAQKHGLRLVESQDITSQVLKTLEIAKNTAEKIALAAEIGTEKFRMRHPLWTRLISLFFRKKYRRLKEEMVLIDSQEFAKNKTYQLLVFARQETGDVIG